MEMPATVTDIFQFLIDEEFYVQALDMVNSRLDYKYYPSWATTASIMRTVLLVSFVSCLCGRRHKCCPLPLSIYTYVPHLMPNYWINFFKLSQTISKLMEMIIKKGIFQRAELWPLKVFYAPKSI